MLRQTIMIITNVLVSVSLSQTKNWTYFCPPLFARQKYFWSILTNTRYVSGQVTLMWTQTVESWDTLNTIQCVWQFVSRHDDVWGVSPSFPYWCHQSPEPQCSRLSLWPQAETGARWHEGVMDGHRVRRVAWVITTWRRKAEGWVLEKQCWQQRAECLWHAGKNCVNLLQTGKAFNYTRAVQIEFCFRPISPIS